MGIICFLKHPFQINYTNFVYVILGLIFEILFGFSKFEFSTLTFLYDVIFPISVTITIFIHWLNDFKRILLGYLVIISILIFSLNSLDFISINYTLSIVILLIKIIQHSKYQKLDLDFFIIILIGINLYLMSILNIISHKSVFWETSIYVDYARTFLFIFLIPTLILINVKFWRSLTH